MNIMTVFRNCKKCHNSYQIFFHKNQFYQIFFLKKKLNNYFPKKCYKKKQKKIFSEEIRYSFLALSNRPIFFTHSQCVIFLFHSSLGMLRAYMHNAYANILVMFFFVV